MSKWKYDQAGYFLPQGIGTLIPGQVKNPRIRAVTEAFIANARRIHTTWKLKPDLVEHACVNTENLCRAFFEMTGHLDFAKALHDDPNIQNKLSKKLTDWFAAQTANAPDPYKVFYDPERAIMRFVELADNYPDKWGEGLHATLAAMLTGAWTSFEVLASDLWEAALNVHPRTLTNLKGKTEDISTPHLLNVMRKVTRGTFNASELMGTILREKFAFHKLSGIRKAYSAAFSKRCEKVDEILSDRAFDKLNLVRNLLLHKGGIVEEEKFLKAAKDTGWSPPGTVGELFPIDGETVSGLIRPVFQRCADLILAVDDWIRTTPSDADDS